MWIILSTIILSILFLLYLKAQRVTTGPPGIVATSGSVWKEHRSLFSKCFRTFGASTATMETEIHITITKLIKELGAKPEKPLLANKLFSKPIITIVWKILFGRSFDYEDPNDSSALSSVQQFFEENHSTAISISLPFLNKVIPGFTGQTAQKKGFAKIMHFVKNEILKRKVAKSSQSCYIDMFLEEEGACKDMNSSFHRTQNQLVYSVMDALMIGIDPTTSTLVWLVAYSLNYPEVQQKLQDEIDFIVGKLRYPTLNDRLEMPYTLAVINETLRCSTITPIGLMHNSTEEINFLGFVIPKNTMVLPNVYSVHYDRNIWGDPEVFRPERFLDSNGKFIHNENLLAFSAGKRICIGINLALDQLFLFTTRIFQTFTIRPSATLPSLKPRIGVSLQPEHFYVTLENRNKKLQLRSVF